MKTHQRNLFHRPATLQVGLAVTLLAAALGLAQCRMVENPVSGVNARATDVYGDHRSKHSVCEHECDKAYKKCKRAEDRRYEDARDECKDRFKKSSKDRDACLRDARRAHEAAIKECKRAKKQCKRDCDYSEGAGSAGR